MLEETERRLEELTPSREAYDEALVRASIELEERKLALSQAQGTQERRSVLTTRAITNNSFSINGSGTGDARELTIKEKAERALVDEELEYLIYWADLTQFVRDRWGVMEDGLKNEYTRLFDFNSTKGFYCPEESPEGLCGIHQLIARQEFTRLDGLGNKDGRLQRSELYAEFPPDGNAAFKQGWDWDKAVAYGKEKLLDGNGLAMRAWEEAYGQSQAIFDASMKDALLRNYWTVCGLNKSSVPLVASGNVSKDASQYEWLGYKSFDRDQKAPFLKSALCL